MSDKLVDCCSPDSASDKRPRKGVEIFRPIAHHRQFRLARRLLSYTPEVTPVAKRTFEIAEPKGKLGVLLPGMGAVATTFIAGVEAVRRQLARPIGSLTQMGTIRLGKRTDRRIPLIKDFVPLAGLNDLVFGGWDLFRDNSYAAALKAGVLERALLGEVKDFLTRIRPMPAVFEQKFVRNLHGEHVKKGKTKMHLADQVMEDIARFRKSAGASRLVMVWCGSTEAYLKPGAVHRTLAAFEKGLKNNSPDIAPSMIYAYAALQSGVPFANGAPNLTVDIPAIQELAQSKCVPICGKDFKTGQTLMKTILAPGLKARLLGLTGWFSTNILGNRDGEVLDDPYSFKTKEESKLSVLEYILQPDLYPELYKDFHHIVRINYYPPRGDNKEGWDNIDIFGWLGYPMQIKIDFLCRDSILAAPIVLDLVLFLDLAQRTPEMARKGIQEWLSFYFKSPMCAPNLYPEHDLFIQLMKLKNTLRHLRGEELITHLGLEYYD
jgi:myo-inositol-1-phosphate synthase